MRDDLSSTLHERPIHTIRTHESCVSALKQRVGLSRMLATHRVKVFYEPELHLHHFQQWTKTVWLTSLEQAFQALYTPDSLAVNIYRHLHTVMH